VSEWQTSDTAPKDGSTFFAVEWHGKLDDSLCWALYWNGEKFEATNNADDQLSAMDFTHWMIPEPPKT